jgi:hypothetical protein
MALANWLPASNALFNLFLRGYLSDEAIWQQACTQQPVRKVP